MSDHQRIHTTAPTNRASRTAWRPMVLRVSTKESRRYPSFFHAALRRPRLRMRSVSPFVVSSVRKPPEESRRSNRVCALVRVKGKGWVECTRGKKLRKKYYLPASKQRLARIREKREALRRHLPVQNFRRKRISTVMVFHFYSKSMDTLRFI